MLTETKRIRKTHDFKRVYEQGRYVVSRSLVLYYFKTGKESRFGFVVSKKVGGACVRNLTKRQLRETVRHFQSRFPQGFDFVFVARPLIVNDTYGQLNTVVLRLLKKTGLSPDRC